ncbi:leucine-rich repeat flightless-interacting protein 2 isoform X1 [Tetranychus urticae]|uniref:leucine-rich repeat flightless-interacting protein 2 isoform X1 n=1 Tax=Tetranychus urticae TaxID=32264 RepID=UPI00077BA404|nr:leucine-rich repeat flightless-interacting protein 2 isoform X1 [Tetranychus urticae]
MIELEEKLKKALITNSQLDNEKNTYSYQVELLKDDLEELQENYYRLQRELKEKSRVYDLLSRDYKELKDRHKYLEECIKQRDSLIEERGLVFVEGSNLLAPLSTPRDSLSDTSEKRVNGETGESSFSSSRDEPRKLGATLISREVAELFDSIEGASLEEKLRTIAQEKIELVQEIEQLKRDLEDEKQKSLQLQGICQMYSNHSVNGSESELVEAQSKEIERENNKLLYEYKFKLKKAEQEIITLQNTVSRVEMQVERYKKQLEQAEKSEDELKTDKRKILREFREAQARIEELETSNAHLQKRIDKLKNNRIAVINS